MTYKEAVVKRNIELILISPLVWLGKITGKFFPLKTTHTTFLFFPSADIGGAVKVNADIVHCIKEKKPLIIFSKKPKNNEFLKKFQTEDVRIIDLHKYIDNKWLHFINIFYRGIISSWINKAQCPVVFGGESIFFYKIIPHIKSGSKKIELCHVNTWLNYSQAFIKYVDKRIFSTQKIKKDAEKQYMYNKVPLKYLDRLLFIDNKVDIPLLQKTTNPVLEVLYVGRGAPQKRVHLIAEMAKQMQENKYPVHFSFVGDVEKIIPASAQQYCTLYGNINDEKKLHEIYQQADVLLFTSSYEGLPIAIMDMMARGKVIVSTAVDGIPDYITHKDNGLLITEMEENKIIESGIELLMLLVNDNELKKSIGKKSYEYAVKHFGGETFCTTYNKLLQNNK